TRKDLRLGRPAEPARDTHAPAVLRTRRAVAKNLEQPRRGGGRHERLAAELGDRGAAIDGGGERRGETVAGTHCGCVCRRVSLSQQIQIREAVTDGAREAGREDVTERVLEPVGV